jgi:uncharacterized protein (DUF1499 family)
MPHIYAVVFTIALASVINGCSGLQHDTDVVQHERLPECPDRPNCVSSDAKDARHAIAPMRLKGDAATGWAAVQQVVRHLPRGTIVKATDRYLHVIFKSRLFRFIDDMQLKLDSQNGIIAIRSASRTGYFDLGVNRRRVEALRKQLITEGIIR